MSDRPLHVMVLRFSAMGDVALVTPIVKSFLKAFPEHRLTLVSRPKFSAFFSAQSNFNYFNADVDKTYSGWLGTIKLYRHLRKLKPDVIIDLHDHIRSRLICFLFRLVGVKVLRFEKGRPAKHAVTRPKNKIRTALPHTVERYRRAFLSADFDFSIKLPPYIDLDIKAKPRVQEWLFKNNLVHDKLWIGVAPFAAHKSKIWPLENYYEVIRLSLQKMKCHFFLFGGGASEVTFFQQLKTEFPDYCTVVAGQLNLTEELALMSHLNKMLCVDSSNMHLAALVGIPTVSIWGGTHADTGFGPFGNSNHRTIEVAVTELACRPCSVYGKEICTRGDFACLSRITPEQVAAEI